MNDDAPERAVEHDILFDMIKDAAFWEAWEDDFIRSRPADLARNTALLDAMYEQARAMGIFPLADPLEGIEVKIRIAQALNVRTTPRTDRTRS